MLVLGFPAAAFATNCFVMAPGPGRECVIVDPGVGVAEQVGDILRAHRLRPAAVVLTHGHLDHTYAAAQVCRDAGVAAWIHRDDVYRLEDPLGDLSPQLRMAIEQEFGQRPEWTAPEEVREFGDEGVVELAGLRFEVLHAPGHTEGSTLLAIEAVPDEVRDTSPLRRTLLSGDVLFQGSVGRTDLPGGDAARMQQTLRDVVLTRPDDTFVLCGHGPATTIAHERAANPFLRGL